MAFCDAFGSECAEACEEFEEAETGMGVDSDCGDDWEEYLEDFWQGVRSGYGNFLRFIFDP